MGALVFPYGLVLIVLTGVDLCTGTFMVSSNQSSPHHILTASQYTAVSVLHRRLSLTKMLIHWAVTFFGNLAGSLFIVAIIIGCKSPNFPIPPSPLQPVPSFHMMLTKPFRRRCLRLGPVQKRSHRLCHKETSSQPQVPSQVSSSLTLQR
jgi:hypothetical protein